MHAHAYTDQSRAERYGHTIRSRNVRSDDSEPSQQCTPIDETTDSESEYIKNPRLSTIPEKYLPTYNDVISCPPHVCSPAKTFLQLKSTTLPRGSEVQPNEDYLKIADSKQVRCSMK